MNWERVVVAIPTYAGQVRPECQESLDRLKGAHVVKLGNQSDVCQARSALYTHVVKHYRDRCDFVLLVDDDIRFSEEAAVDLLALCDLLLHAVSGVYCSTTKQLTASRSVPPLFDAQGKELWLAGLGFMAIPMVQFAELADSLEPVLLLNQWVHEFCTSGGYNGRWEPDDYSLCRRLGGVHLAPIGVAHMKVCGLEPDAETLRRIAEGEPLDDDPNAPPEPRPVPQQALKVQEPTQRSSGIPKRGWKQRQEAERAQARRQSDVPTRPDGTQPLRVVAATGVVLEPLDPVQVSDAMRERAARAELALAEQQHDLLQVEGREQQHIDASDVGDAAAVLGLIEGTNGIEPTTLDEVAKVEVSDVLRERAQRAQRALAQQAADVERSEQEQAAPGLRSQPDTSSAPQTAR